MGTDAAFAALGIAAGSSPTEITRSFRVLCRVTHPDHGGDRARFETVLDAYRTLQAAGLVVRTHEEPVTAAPCEPTAEAAAEAPVAAPAAAEAPVAVPCAAARGTRSPADLHYRRFLAGLDVAATFVPRPARHRRPTPTATPATSASAFADLLERELRRSAA